MKWETIISSKELTIDMGILPSAGKYIVRVFLDREPPHELTWKPSYSRVIEKSYQTSEVPELLKKLIDMIPEHGVNEIKERG